MGWIGEFEGDAAGVANAVFDALGERDVDAIAGREFAAGLRDADDGAAGLHFARG